MGAVEEYLRKYRREERSEESVGMGGKKGGRKKKRVQKIGGVVRTQRQFEYDKMIELRRYLQGWTYAEIADEVNMEAEKNGLEYRLSADRVKSDVTGVLAQRARLLRSEGGLENMVAKEAAKLDLLEKEAWFDYMESRKKKVTVKDANGEMVTTTRDSVGNPKFLDVLLRISERRGKLLGVDSPLQVDIRARQGGDSRGYDFSGIPEDELAAMAEKMMNARREIPTTGVVVESKEMEEKGNE